jgi:tRNA pseudouridine65 synthase
MIADSLSISPDGLILPEVIFHSDDMIAINKPSGYLVHPSEWAGPDPLPACMQICRDYIGKHVYPVHRLDRQTSGVLLFALHTTAEKVLNRLFEERKLSKKYLAIVRGFTPDQFVVDYELEKESTGKFQSALTEFKTLQRVELPIPNKRYPTSRYSLIEACPLTGRTHQIRRHLSHQRFPIIGDKRNGDNTQNHALFSVFGIDRLLLHASELSFEWEGQPIQLKATPYGSFKLALEQMEFNWQIFC